MVIASVNIPIASQNLGVSQNWRSRFSPIEAASYPKDRSDGERVKDRDANEGKNQVLNHDRYIRSIIQDLVSSLVPFDSIETQHIEFVKKWISSGASLFRIQKPAAPDTHLASYFVLIDSVTNKLLLVDHKQAGLWLPTGGHMEPNEHPE